MEPTAASAITGFLTAAGMLLLGGFVQFGLTWLKGRAALRLKLVDQRKKAIEGATGRQADHDSAALDREKLMLEVDRMSYARLEGVLANADARAKEQIDRADEKIAALEARLSETEDELDAEREKTWRIGHECVVHKRDLRELASYAIGVRSTADTNRAALLEHLRVCPHADALLLVNPIPIPPVPKSAEGYYSGRLPSPVPDEL